MKKLAIVGSGISAMSVAFYLCDKYDISIFDKNDYLGGHTHTHRLNEAGKDFTIDTGFMVFNEETYPNLLQLFSDLGVEKQKSEMSFSVYNQTNGLQFAGTDLATVFAQKKNLFSLRYWWFLLAIKKFFRIALRDFQAIKGSKETIRDYCHRNELPDFFIDNFLAPMSSAVWSVPQKAVADFPIALLLPFFYNHGLLQASGQFQWYTVQGGSDFYIQKIMEQGEYDVHLEEAVLSAVEQGTQVQLKTSKGVYDFDYVVLASHADESLRIASALDLPKKIMLDGFTYNSNLAVVHSDESIMPPLKKVWSAWNQIVNKDGESSTVYWVNKLQKPRVEKNYFVSINPNMDIKEETIIKKINYRHPNFTTANSFIQSRLQDLNKNSRILFSGSYFGYGFHEDGIKSGLKVVELLKNK